MTKPHKTGTFDLLHPPLAAVGVLLLAIAVCPCYAVDRDKPNIVLILADDLGYGDLGCYGQKAIHTPHLDQMAAEGLRFTDHYAGSTVCAPSRCSLMTGMHTGHALVRGNKETRPMGQMPLPLESVTVAELLGQAGYSTALVGKWGLGGPNSTGEPNRQGFDLFFGYLCQRHAHNYYPEFLFRNAQRLPLEGNRIAKPRPDGAGMAVDRKQYSHDLFVAEALHSIEENRAKPFFLYLALTIPHANNEAGNRGMEVPDLGEYAELDWPEPQKGHAAMISRMDADVGRVLEKLRQLDLDKKTLVFFTSDNGPHREGGSNPQFNNSSGPLRGIKRDLFEGGIRVPMIAWWPETIAPGGQTDLVSAFWDFLPTACEVAGVEPPRVTDGISFVPTLLGDQKNQKHHEYLYWEYYTNQAIRMGPWKAMRSSPLKALNLYHLESDLGETRNVAKENVEMVRKIEKVMNEAHVDSPDFKFLSR